MLFFGVGKVATEYHIDHIAPKEPPRGPKSHIAILCGVVFVMGLLLRVVFYFVAGGV